jgi:hypothetical protein
LAGAENIEGSYFLTKSMALDAFPMLKKDDLFGAIVYYGRWSFVEKARPGSLFFPFSVAASGP